MPSFKEAFDCEQASAFLFRGSHHSKENVTTTTRQLIVPWDNLRPDFTLKLPPKINLLKQIKMRQILVYTQQLLSDPSLTQCKDAASSK